MCSRLGVFYPPAILSNLKPTFWIALGKFEGEWELMLYPKSDPDGRKAPVIWAR